jgi:hypothetical protein
MDEEEQQARPRDLAPLAGLGKLLIFAVIGLLMWIMCGRIGGHPFPH